MERIIIHAKDTDAYLSDLNDFKNGLPVNCLFDKGKTGCGGTTIAINNDRDTIISMPYINLIKNKINQPEKNRHELLGVHGDFNEKAIIDYINTHEIKKIAVTYESTRRLIQLLEILNIDVYNKFFFLVDEWHILFNSYTFRNEGIKEVLKISRQFSEVTYMTATPIEEEFVLKELKDLPIVEVKWKNVATVDILPIPTNSPVKEVCRRIKTSLNGKMFGNLHFFVNSVEFIAEAIKISGLEPKDVRIVCSKNEKQGKGKKSNQAKLGKDYLIEETTDPVKKVNFYTSTAFEGCDIYDENGRTYIVSDTRMSHTLLDISTLIIQICGRIRNSKYNNKVAHIFSETRYSKIVTLEEFKESAYKVRDESKSFIEEINKMSDINRKKTIRMFIKGNKAGLNEQYITDIEDILELDENLINRDIINFKITHHLYQARVTLFDEYKRYGFNMLAEKPKIYSKEELATDKLVANPKAKISFKDLFEEYAQILEEQPIHFHFGNPEDRRTLIEQEKPLIKESFEKLGVNKVRELKYNVTNIKREIFKNQSDISMDAKIVKCLKDIGITSRLTETSNKLKEHLQEIYESLEYKDSRGHIKKAKATDLDNWFEIKKTTPKINKKTTDCYTIIRDKLIYK
ncbi:MAG: hypothetical protein E6772_08630 [Dysgonomonas sp.]|nr:hypothetical protein [Dysgonomonas sp.]